MDQRVGDGGEAVLDPWVAEWLAANPMTAPAVEDLGPELLPLARGPAGAPPEREVVGTWFRRTLDA